MRIIKIRRFTQEEGDIEWLVHNLLPNAGSTIIYGESGVGKTTFIMQLCDAIQRGIPFLGRETKQTDICYLQCDVPTDIWRQMLKRIAPESEAFTIVDVIEKCLGQPDAVVRIKKYIEMYKPGLIVFDSFYTLSPWSINTEQALVAISHIKQICQYSIDESIVSIPWILIHHPPHHESRLAGHHSVGGTISNRWGLFETELRIEKGWIVKDKKILLARDEDNGLWTVREEGYSGSAIHGLPLDWSKR